MPLKPFAANHGPDKKIFLLKPRGFCAGVVRAIDVVKIALDLYGPPVYVRKEIVHNKHVVEELRAAGAIFVEELDETREIVTRLKERFPLIQGPPAQDICYATENRQMAVKAVSEACELLLVVGSQNSSNSKRLVEVGDNFGVRSYLVNDRTDVDANWLEGVRNVAVTAGASAPEHLVQELMEFLHDSGFRDMEEIELVDEDVRFSL